ncbi:tetratricopeptide repeat protein [candidate division KSB1 bacterium]|nr:tetratricopeptide repeat protein [candidate division KSB1 bacterium]
MSFLSVSIFSEYPPGHLLSQMTHQTPVFSLSKALLLSEEARIHAKSMHSPADMVDALTASAGLNYILGHLQEAQTDLLNALEMCRGGPLRYRRISILRNLAELYAAVKLTSCALQCGKQAVHQATLTGDSLEMAKSWLSMGTVFSRIGKSEEALEYVQVASHQIHQSNSQQLIGRLWYEKGCVYMQLGEYDRALENLRQVVLIAAKQNDKPGLAFGIRDMAETYFYMGDYPSAMTLYRHALSILPGHIPYIELVSSFYISKIHESRGESEKALDWLKTHINLKNEIFSGEVRRRILRSQIQFEETARLALIEHRIRIYSIAIAGISFLVLISFVSARYYAASRKRQKRLYEQKVMNMTSIVKTMIEGNRLLKSNLEHRERELTAKSIIMLEKRNLLKYIHHRLTKMKTDQVLNDRQIEEPIKMIEDYINSDDLKNEFEKCFSEVHNKFYKHLARRAPNLTPQETRICAFIKIGLRNKEVARLLHVTEPTVEIHRIHIRKKLLLDRQTNLSTYISHL